MLKQLSHVDGAYLCGSRRSQITSPPTNYHRIGEVLKEEGIGVDFAAARMGIHSSQASAEAEATCDLTLSDLQRWQAALEVPIEQLLVRSTPPLTPIFALRARLVEAIRTAEHLHLKFDGDGQVAAISLSQQLREMMPELTALACWHASGRP